MATSKGQRIGILAIAVIMIVGTIGSFAVMVVANRNDQEEYSRQQTAMKQWQDEYAELQQAQAEELTKKYYPEFSKYSDRPAKFSLDSVNELATSDLKEGDGQTIDETTSFAAYYIGWNIDGKVFDQSIEGDSLKTPLSVDGGLANASLIEGWKEGMQGMKIGGVRLIEIPSDLAYGEAGSGDDIPPNSPIKFVVMAIETPEPVEMPEMPAILQGGF